MKVQEARKHVAELCAKYGYEVAGYTAKGHLKLIHSSGKTVFAPKTPSDWRSLKNLESKMRRAAHG